MAYVRRRGKYTREMLEKRLETAKKSLKDAEIMLIAWDKAQEIAETDSIETKIKKMYIRLQSVNAVGEWAFENIPGFEANKTRAQAKTAEILDNKKSEDADIEQAAAVIRSENYARVNAAWN